jgi:hypothetical protein
MTAELWHRAVPILPSHDLTATAGFWGSLGFAISLRDAYLMLRQGEVELHYVAAPDLDPFHTAWVAYLRVTQADLLHADVREADVMPDLGPDEGSGDLAELQARWQSDRDVARLGVPTTTEHRTREFVIFDPSNNQITCGHPLGDA